MKGSLFVYSRLEKLDYRLIYAPPKNILASPFRDDFIDFAREVINVDNVLNGQIKTFRWSLIKRENVVMVGIGCLNRQLGVQNVDFAGREVRGFFGVVMNEIENNVINTLCDVKFYKSLYELYIAPLWSITEQKKANSIHKDVQIDGECYDCKFNIDVNVDNSRVKIFPQEISFKDVLLSTICHDSIDVVYNLNNLQHITSSELYHFHNATIIGNDEESLHQLPTNTDEDELDHAEELEKSKSLSKVVRNTPNEDNYTIQNVIQKLIEWLRKRGFSIEQIIGELVKICEKYKSKKRKCENLTFSETNKSYRFKQNESEPQLVLNTLDRVEDKEEKKKRLAEIKKQRRLWNDSHDSQSSSTSPKEKPKDKSKCDLSYVEEISEVE